MEKDRDIFLEGLTKIINLTQKGNIVWSAADASDIVCKPPEDKIKIAFKTYYLGKGLRIYERTYKEIVNPPSAFTPISVYVFEQRKPGEYWYSEIVLETLDDSGRPVFQFPRTIMLKDLFFAVQYQVSGIKEYLDKILSENEDDK